MNKTTLAATTIALFFIASVSPAFAQMHAFNGDDNIDEIDVQVVYYVAKGVEPLPDWRERIEYHLARVQKFHQRELAGQSNFTYHIHPAPFVASATPNGFPHDDVNKFYWQIVNEVWHSGEVEWKEGAFPILLVMGDCNFSPGYDDWTRVCNPDECFLEPPHKQCAGHVSGNGEDRPGSRAGGARSVYWADQHIGLGLVTADGWRVPIKGTDCVTYHEGIGHAIGLPHPEPINASVMGTAQYVDSIQATWIDDDQKAALNWTPVEINKNDLFSTFSISHQPSKPTTNTPITLYAKLPLRFSVARIQAEIQRALRQPFEALPAPYRFEDEQYQYFSWSLPPLALNQSLAYRIRVETQDGESEIIWDYLKARDE